jgi:hypothetical protein
MRYTNTDQPVWPLRFECLMRACDHDNAHEDSVGSREEWHAHMAPNLKSA